MDFDFNELLPDADKAGGIWTRCYLNRRDGTRIDTGTDLLIAYAVDNSQFERRQAQLTAKAQREARNRELNQAEFNEIVRRAAVGSVLKDWRGYRLNGQDVPYTAQAAEKAMLSSTQFATFVAGFAGDLANFRAETEPEQPAGEHAGDSSATDGEEEQDATTEGVLKTADEVVGSQP